MFYLVMLTIRAPAAMCRIKTTAAYHLLPHFRTAATSSVCQEEPGRKASPPAVPPGSGGPGSHQPPIIPNFNPPPPPPLSAPDPVQHSPGTPPPPRSAPYFPAGSSKPKPPPLDPSGSAKPPLSTAAAPYSEIPQPPGLPLLRNMVQLLWAENTVHMDRFHGRLKDQYGDIYRQARQCLVVILYS
jgi:hypothetical protein